MVGKFGKEWPLRSHLSKKEDLPGLGHHSPLPQEEELDHYGEELPHLKYLLKVFVPHYFEYSLPIITIGGLDAKAHNQYTLVARYWISKKVRVS